jgi:hypothetical protein
MFVGFQDLRYVKCKKSQRKNAKCSGKAVQFFPLHRHTTFVIKLCSIFTALTPTEAI